ncbi:MAG TPA: SpoIVB peptidase S55 domain-containing protein, partial [Terriglobia bacterium]
FPLDEIQPGMKGTGKTVLSGTRIEEFQVEILGVLRNMAPRQSLILARLSGARLEQTGVLAGMSGSPVYIDGRLIGAVAMTFQFIKEPIAGITPIEQMIGSLAEETPAASPSQQMAWRFEPEAGSGDLRVLPLEVAKLSPPEETLTNRVIWGGAETSLSRVGTPLVLAGFTSQAVEFFEPQFRNLGLVPIQGGMGSGTAETTEPAAALEPGSMISVQLVRGDMGVSADGTVTLIDEGRIYAFGHPFLSIGPLEVPFGESRVIAAVPGYATSMKITTPGRVLGVIKKDRASGIYGVLGEQARMIPVDVDLATRDGASHSYRFEVANDRFLLPFLMNLTVFSAVGSTERQVGDSTLQVEQTISLEGLPDVELESFISGGANGPAMAARSAAVPLAYLMQSGLGPLDVRNIRLKILSTNQRLTQELEQVWTSRREVKAGEAFELTALLRDQDGRETLQKTTIEIPSSLRPGPLTITVADGASLDRIEAGMSGRMVLPKDPQQLVRAINRARRNNRLYVRLARPETGFVLQGDSFPSPPPSVVSTLSTTPSLSTNVSRTMLSTVADYELEPVSGVVAGVKGLALTVEE